MTGAQVSILGSASAHPWKFRVILAFGFMVSACVAIVPDAWADKSDAGGVEGFVEDNVISVGGLRQAEQDEELFQAASVEDHPYVYRHERVCIVDNSNIDVGCEMQRLQCDAAEDGMLVQWYRAHESSPDAWTEWNSPVCIYPSDPMFAEEELPTISIQEFRELPIVGANSIVQPEPHTLRGANTNFVADPSRQNFSLTLAGYDVDVRAIPVSFQWTYGDGESLGPVSTPGVELSKDNWGTKTPTSHIYKQTGDYGTVLTTNFIGMYSVDGGPWIPIPGQAAVESAPVTISVWRSETKNYADNCFENPQGAGCQGASG